MVSPIILFVVALAFAFLAPLFDRISRRFAYLLALLTLGFMAWIPGYWLAQLLAGAQEPLLFTAGLRPPISIMLRMGPLEAALTFLVNLCVLLSAIHMHRELTRGGVQPLMLLVVLAMGFSGMVMTRDVFNLFVFIEIASIATYGLIALGDEKCALSAGFKYAVAGGLSSILFLLGVIYLYRFTGVLWLDQMIAQAHLLRAGGGFIALFLLLMAVLIELKPFPANGWALDVYQTAHPALAAVLSAAGSAAMLAALYKLLPLASYHMLSWIAGLGAVTFVASNLAGSRQTNVRRMLGYSSVAQIGLLIAVLALYRLYVPGEERALFLPAGMLFVSHFFAKAGLFWLAGAVRGETIDDWGALRRRPDLIFLMGVLLLSLAGLPPFPGFWGKWTLVMDMLGRAPVLMGVVLFGSLIEAWYLFRWFGRMLHGEQGEARGFDPMKTYPAVLAGLLLIVGGLALLLTMSPQYAMQLLVPLLGGALLFAMDRAPGRYKGVLSLALLVAFFNSILFQLVSLGYMQLLFAFLFIIGGAVLLVGSMRDNDRRPGFYPLLMMLLLSLGALVRAQTNLSFFIAWEWMTISSWLLLLRSRGAERSALQYLMFSLGAATLLLAGFGLLGDGALSVRLPELFLYEPSMLAVGLILLAMLVKLGSLGVHVWLPNAYADADDDLTPFFSALLSKAPVFGLLMFGAWLGLGDRAGIGLAEALGWLGAATAFYGSLMAVFQEDIKRLLAYSSIGQMGYVLMTIALFSHVGWIAALYMVLLHVMSKGLLFLAASGVIRRAGTSNMYEMGGLIKRMPLSFTSVLIAIIAVSGVPPLAGFGAKWLIYQSLFEKGWYMQMGVAFFSGAISFLYLFRLIHVMFLGQLKTRLRKVREASVWTLAPQYIMVGAIMAVSMFPRWIVVPLQTVVEQFMPGDMAWRGNTLLSKLGYWDGNMVMNITMGVFVLVFVYLFVWSRKVQKVGQFNIVYAAEAPETPESTHAGYNFYPFYRKALGFLIPPAATGFWNGVAEWTASLGSVVRQLYTGNAQTYALHIVLYVTVVYFLMGS